MENLQAQLEASQAELVSKQAELVTKQSELAALEDIPENLEARQNLESEITALEAQIGALESEISTLEAQIAAAIARAALEARIEALGDIALLIDNLFQERASDLRPQDSWNPCAFCADHIETQFGWHFEIITKPTLAELEGIRLALDAPQE